MSKRLQSDKYHPIDDDTRDRLAKLIPSITLPILDFNAYSADLTEPITEIILADSCDTQLRCSNCGRSIHHPRNYEPRTYVHVTVPAADFPSMPKGKPAFILLTLHRHQWQCPYCSYKKMQTRPLNQSYLPSGPKEKYSKDFWDFIITGCFMIEMMKISKKLDVQEPLSVGVSATTISDKWKKWIREMDKDYCSLGPLYDPETLAIHAFPCRGVLRTMIIDVNDMTVQDALENTSPDLLMKHFRERRNTLCGNTTLKKILIDPILDYNTFAAMLNAIPECRGIRFITYPEQYLKRMREIVHAELCLFADRTRAELVIEQSAKTAAPFSPSEITEKGHELTDQFMKTNDSLLSTNDFRPKRYLFAGYAEAEHHIFNEYFSRSVNYIKLIHRREARGLDELVRFERHARSLINDMIDLRDHLNVEYQKQRDNLVAAFEQIIRDESLKPLKYLYKLTANSLKEDQFKEPMPVQNYFSELKNLYRETIKTYESNGFQFMRARLLYSYKLQRSYSPALETSSSQNAGCRIHFANNYVIPQEVLMEFWDVSDPCPVDYRASTRYRGKNWSSQQDLENFQKTVDSATQDMIDAAHTIDSVMVKMNYTDSRPYPTMKNADLQTTVHCYNETLNLLRSKASEAAYKIYEFYQQHHDDRYLNPSLAYFMEYSGVIQSFINQLVSAVKDAEIQQFFVPRLKQKEVLDAFLKRTEDIRAGINQSNQALSQMLLENQI